MGCHALERVPVGEGARERHEEAAVRPDRQVRVDGGPLRQARVHDEAEGQVARHAAVAREDEDVRPEQDQLPVHAERGARDGLGEGLRPGDGAVGLDGGEAVGPAGVVDGARVDEDVGAPRGVDDHLRGEEALRIGDGEGLRRPGDLRGARPGEGRLVRARRAVAARRRGRARLHGGGAGDGERTDGGAAAAAGRPAAGAALPRKNEPRLRPAGGGGGEQTSKRKKEQPAHRAPWLRSTR